jgi:hypothetical protein
MVESLGIGNEANRATKENVDIQTKVNRSDLFVGIGEGGGKENKGDSWSAQEILNAAEPGALEMWPRRDPARRGKIQVTVCNKSKKEWRNSLTSTRNFAKVRSR